MNLSFLRNFTNFEFSQVIDGGQMGKVIRALAVSAVSMGKSVRQSATIVIEALLNVTASSRKL